jgi:phage tail sheath gpL-like
MVRLMRSILSRVSTSADSFCSISPSRWSLTSLKASKASMNSSKAAVTVSGTAFTSGAVRVCIACSVISIFP